MLCCESMGESLKSGDERRLTRGSPGCASGWSVRSSESERTCTWALDGAGGGAEATDAGASGSGRAAETEGMNKAFISAMAEAARAERSLGSRAGSEGSRSFGWVDGGGLSHVVG